MAQETTSATRDAILDAADRLLGRLGFRKTTLDDLARESGVGRRTIYLHFASKEDVALASIDRVVERLCARLDALAASESPAPEKLRAMLRERVLFRVDSVRDYFHGLDELFAVLRPRYMERRERYFADEAERFARVIRAGAKAGELTAPDPDAAARAMLLATNALLPYSLSPRELGARAKVARDVDTLADCLLDGLVARRNPGRSAARRRGLVTKR
ncbi:MAG: TetR/AcrR family transcriptional regulator [Planctomycetes bacterium]|nr:TetR/AcrR family transcriptional regulator [Planctomycetota bacterium]